MSLTGLLLCTCCPRRQGTSLKAKCCTPGRARPGRLADLRAGALRRCADTGDRCLPYGTGAPGRTVH